MNWKLIDKSRTVQPKRGTWKSKNWKEILAQEGFNQCVYCSIHESPFGGIRNYVVEHYKPRALFPKLENNMSNLFYACCICNGFKNKDWFNVSATNLNAVVYPNPSITDYNLLFQLNRNGEVEGKNIAGKYIVERLFINRPQLILDRSLKLAKNIEDNLIKKYDRQFNLLTKIIHEKGDLTALKLIEDMKFVTDNLRKLSKHIESTRPYTLNQIRKPKKKRSNVE